MSSFACLAPGRASRSALAAVSLVTTLASMALGCEIRRPPPDAGRDGGGTDVPIGVDVPPGDAPRDTSYDAPIIIDEDAACATASARGMITRLPVDIIWVVDNSGSMSDEIMEVQRGLDDFTAMLAAGGLDYRLIMLSLRTPTSGRFPVCVPPPVAGPACADGERFFQIDVDIASQQVLEHVLGTLAQSDGYREGDSRGGPPWAHLLRPGATRAFVVVTDDNQRTCSEPGSGMCAAGDPVMSPLFFEDFEGGPNPFNNSTLGPGILDDTYGDTFEGYVFNALYGWGSETDPDVACGAGAAAGQTYTRLVERTGGVRAQICDGAAAWGPFFEAVANTAITTSRIECDLAVPMPPEGMILLPTHVNVNLNGAAVDQLLPRVTDMASCDAVRGGWYFDDNTTPTRIFLCPSTCELARAEVIEEGTSLDVLFGCESVVL